MLKVRVKNILYTLRNRDEITSSFALTLNLALALNQIKSNIKNLQMEKLFRPHSLFLNSLPDTFLSKNSDS